jgi:hypothetical protein
MAYILATGLYENNDYITSINYLTITTTSLFNLIQDNTTSISILNISSASLLGLINALTNPTTLNVNNLNVSQISILNGAVTCKSSLLVAGNIQANQYTFTLNNNNPYISWGSNLIGTYSSASSYIVNSATIGDFIIKGGSGSNLRLQTGSGSPGIIIDAYNNIVLNNSATCASSLTVNGVTILKNNTSIKGIADIHNGNKYAVLNGRMQNGSLTIGDTLLNYGNKYYSTPAGYDGPDWTTNTCGLLMECVDNTEIAVHRNSDNNVSSLLCYQGSTINTIFIGRDMGWGPSSLNIAGITKIGTNTLALTDSVFEVFNNILVRKNVTVNDINYGEYVDIYAGIGANTSYISLRQGGDITLTSLKGSVNIMGGGLNVYGPIIADNIIKKKIFNLTCSTPITLNGTTYYRYDIYLDLYTTVYHRYSGQTLLGLTRKFKWISWLATGVHEIGYDLNYDISYSYKSTMPNVGLNVCAYGYPFESKLLSSVNPNGPFLIRNSFDYLTFCCSVQNAVFTVLILDYL